MKDLSTVEHSITNTLLKPENRAKIDSCKNATTFYNAVSEILKDNNIDTPSSRSLLDRLKHCKTANQSTFILWGSIMAGCNNPVIK